jgi:hypothetical protein
LIQLFWYRIPWLFFDYRLKFRCPRCMPRIEFRCVRCLIEFVIWGLCR